MDVDMMPLGGALTDEEKWMLQHENKCFYCKIKGHIVKNCRKKATNRAAATNDHKAARMSTTTVDTQTTGTTETTARITDEEHMEWLQNRSLEEKLDINERIFVEETKQDF